MARDTWTIEKCLRIELRVIIPYQVLAMLEHLVEIILAKHDIRSKSD